MSIEEQIEIVESNISEYGVCNITIEEYRYLKQKIRAEVIDEITQKVEFEKKWLFDCYIDNNLKYLSKDVNIAFNTIVHYLRKLKENK